MQESSNLTPRDIGHLIANARRLKKFTQDELAEKSEISVKYIGDIERGRKKVSLEYFLKILIALNPEIDLKVDNILKNILLHPSKVNEE